METKSSSILENLNSTEYKYGFRTELEADTFPKGLSEEIITKISQIKNEPQFMLDFRLKAYKAFLEMKDPDWALINYPTIDFQDIIYYSAPKKKANKDNLDEVDPEILKTY